MSGTFLRRRVASQDRLSHLCDAPAPSWRRRRAVVIADHESRALPPSGAAQYWRRFSLASRITLLTAAVVAFTVAATAGATFLTVRSELAQAVDDSLLDRARAAADAGALAQVAGKVPSSVLGAADIRIAVVHPDGRIESADRGRAAIELGDRELAVARGSSGRVLRTTTDADGTRWRIAALPVDQGALVLGQSLAPQDRTLRRLQIVLLIFGGLGVVGAAVAGWAVARNGLRPVRRLTTATERVARTLDLQPLHVSGDDELSRLAISFNQMLSVIDASAERQRRLIIDAGHELRTPLTSLRTNFELLIQSDQHGGLPTKARSELVDDIEAQLDELSTLIADVVELARGEATSTNATVEVDLADVVDAALARARRRGSAIRLDADVQPWPTLGDPAALERAAVNILDNAIKYSPRGGRVNVTLRKGVLTVEDQGPGIQPAHRQLVLERFWRAPESRTLPGSGLGLAIVAQVVAAHGGTIQIGDATIGGTRVDISMPARQEREGGR